MQRSLTCNTIKVDKFNPNYRFNREYVYEETWTVHCKTWCPAHIAFQGYIEKASEWKFDEALELIKKIIYQLFVENMQLCMWRLLYKRFYWPSNR